VRAAGAELNEQRLEIIRHRRRTRRLTRFAGAEAKQGCVQSLRPI
jgi:hypothetical protein